MKFIMVKISFFLKNLRVLKKVKIDLLRTLDRKRQLTREIKCIILKKSFFFFLILILLWSGLIFLENLIT
jgi:hypothetical protein